jgi:hypothetical protein
MIEFYRKNLHSISAEWFERFLRRFIVVVIAIEYRTFLIKWEETGDKGFAADRLVFGNHFATNILSF